MNRNSSSVVWQLAVGAAAVLASVAGAIAAPFAVVSAATTTPPAPTTTPPATTDNDHLFTMGTVAIPPGNPGELGIVMQGPDDGSSVPLIVRNNTDTAMYGIEVEGIARDAAGALVASGSSQGFEPVVLQRGEWGMGYVYFDIDVLDGGEQFQFQVTGDTDRGFIGGVNLTVGEATVNQGDYGADVVGILLNNGTETVSGPVSVMVTCFDDAGAIVSNNLGFAEADEVAAGGFTSFSVGLYDTPTCANAAIAASGYDF